jgi:Flp pilus assembly pilin Flp
MQSLRAGIRKAGGNLAASSATLSLDAEPVTSTKAAAESPKWLSKEFNSLLDDETGGIAIEYSLIAAVIALPIIMTVANIGEQVVGMFAAVAAAFG